MPNDLWLIAFYTPEGDNFYTVAGADMKRAQIDLIIATADQPVAEAGVDAPEEADEVVVVKSPVDERHRHDPRPAVRPEPRRAASRRRSRPRIALPHQNKSTSRKST